MKTLFIDTRSDLGYMVEARIEIDDVTGQPYTNLYTPYCVGGAIGQQISSSASISFELVRKIAIEITQKESSTYEAVNVSRARQCCNITEANWKKIVKRI